MSAKPPSVAELARDVARQMRALVDRDQVVELRALQVRRGSRRPHTEAGFFDYDHLEEMGQAAAAITPLARGVYFTLNPLNPDLLARRTNRVEFAEEGLQTKDKDVTVRRRLLIDADPIRDPHISATDEEKARAESVALAVRKYLGAAGWPDPIRGDSGNGFHLIYRIDLPAEDDGLVKRVLQALSARFTTEFVKIDQSVFNPSRICKVPGTLARKGDSTADRPHRRARLIETPNGFTPVPRELLERLAAEIRDEQKPPATGTATSGDGPRLLVERWLTDRSVSYRVKSEPDNVGRTVFVLAECPFDASHAHPDACIMQAADGRLSAKCFHDSCTGRGWKEFKERIGAPERHHYDLPASAPSANGKHDQRSRNAKSEPATERYPLIDSAEFRTRDYRVSWFVDYYLARGYETVVGGPSKALKTSAIVDLGVSGATGTPHLGKWKVSQRFKVAIVSGESGGYALQEIFFRVLRSKGLSVDACDGWLKWEFTLPVLADQIDVKRLAGRLAELGCEMVIIDPLYLCLGGVEAQNVFQMGEALKAVGQILLKDYRVTPVIAHHANKQLRIGQPMELSDLAYTGLEQFAAQYVLLNRREKYENDGCHKLWLTFGGRPGHSGKWVLDVEEGLLDEHNSARKWEVNVTSAAEDRDAKATERNRANQQAQRDRDTADEDAVLAVIDVEAKQGLPGASVSWIGDHAIGKDGKKLGDRRVKAAVSRLCERDVIRRVDPFNRPLWNNAQVKVNNGYGRVPDA